MIEEIKAELDRRWPLNEKSPTESDIEKSLLREGFTEGILWYIERSLKSQ
jgi:hypothetical protein